MADAVVGTLELGLRHEILEHRTVLNLRYTNHDWVILLDSSDVEEHALHVSEFLLILNLVPLLHTIGEELLVVGLWVIVDVEEVLEVVEYYCIWLLLRHTRCYGEQRYK